MKKNVLIFSIIIAAVIFLVLVIGIFWLIYFNWGNTSALKDGISTASGLFGGFATLIATVVAAYLFIDWKDQQNHQNTVQFGMEVYSTFKEYDSLYKNINNELINNREMLKAALQNNEILAVSQFLSELDRTSNKEIELTEKFFILHDSIVNYCIVTNQEHILQNDLSETATSFDAYIRHLSDIRFEDDIPKKQIHIEILTTPPFTQMNTYIYNYYIKSILLKIRLK